MIISDFINVKNKLNFARIMVDGYKLPMQSVPITTNVVRSNSTQARCTTLCDKVCQVTGDRSMVFSGYSGFLHQ